MACSNFMYDSSRFETYQRILLLCNIWLELSWQNQTILGRVIVTRHTFRSCLPQWYVPEYQHGTIQTNGFNIIRK